MVFDSAGGHRTAAAAIYRGSVRGSIGKLDARNSRVDLRRRWREGAAVKTFEESPGFFRRNARLLLGAALALLFLHYDYGPHGYIAMRKTQKEIARVRIDIDRLAAENEELADQVHAPKSDPKLIERIAREEA